MSNEPTIEDVYQEMIATNGKGVRVDRAVRLTLLHADNGTRYNMRQRYLIEILEPGEYCAVCSRVMLSGFRCATHDTLASWHIIHVFGDTRLSGACAQALRYIRGS